MILKVMPPNNSEEHKKNVPIENSFLLIYKY